MASAMNGLALYHNLIPYGGTLDISIIVNPLLDYQL